MRYTGGGTEVVRIEREETDARSFSYADSRLNGGTLNWRLSMPRLAIFDSRVWCGIPSFAAAPRRPETRPWHSANAASIAFRSPLGELFLVFSEGTGARNRAPRQLVRFARQPCLVYRERFFVAQNHGALDDVL